MFKTTLIIMSNSKWVFI